MKEIYYVEMMDYANDLNYWTPIAAFTSGEAAEDYAQQRTQETNGKIYVVQSMRLIK